MPKAKKQRSEAKNRKHYMRTVMKTGKWRGKKAKL